jgi:hypothetical protein
MKTTRTANTVTRYNLASKSKDLDDAKLADAKKRLTVGEGKKKDQGLLLDMARQALSKREDSSVLMISTTVANAMALLKSHLLDLDVEFLCKDFVVDEAEHEALTSGAYDAAHEFASSYDFSSLAESEDNDNPRNM